LSDGERKRVQLARAVMTDPELLLLDEPVASLDLGAREHTVQLLGAYASSPVAPSMIMVTHHLEEIPTGFTHALLLNDGKIVAQGPIDSIISSDLLSETFGFGLNVSQEGGRFQVRAK
jgi:iron complex transport system ATP-binding protein